MLSEFVDRPGRYPRLDRPILQGGYPDGAHALTVFRTTVGMGKTAAARQLMARLAPTCRTLEATGTEIDDAWWGELDRLVLGATVPIVVLIDEVEYVADPEFAERLLSRLESHPRLSFVVAGSYVHELDERGPRLRVPVRTIADEQLRLTAHEVAKLAKLRVPGADAMLANKLFDLTRGWPLAVHDGLVTAARTVPPVLPDTSVDQFCIDLLGDTLKWQSPNHRSALILLAAADEMSAPMLAVAIGISEAEAETVLNDLARVLLRQRIDESGVRWFWVHAVMQRVLWRVRRQLAPPAQMSDAAKRLAKAHPGHGETVVWTEIYVAVDTQNWGELDALLTLHFSDDFIDPPPLLQSQLRTIPEHAKQQFPVLRTTALIEEFAFPRGRRGRVLNEFREIATRTINTESLKMGAVGVLTSGMRLGSGRLSGDETTVRRMLAQFREQLDRLEPDSRVQARTMVATGCGQAAIAAWYLEDFDAAEAWCQTGLAQFNGGATISTVHLTSLSAVVAAWRGDIPEAEDRLRECLAQGAASKWVNHYVAVAYWIAEAIVALERGDYERARLAYERVSWRLLTNEHWPYLVWVNAHLIEHELTSEHALAWLNRQGELHQVGFALHEGPRRAVESLRARLAWKQGRHQLLPARRTGGDVASIYAALADGQYAEGESLAAGTVDFAAKKGFWRLEARALELQMIAEHKPGSAPNSRLRERADRVTERYQLSTLEADRFACGDASCGGSDPGRYSHEPPPSVGPARSGAGGVPGATGRLTPAEVRTLSEVAKHGTTTAAARALNLSVHTVRDHLKSSYKKLGVRTRADAITRAATIGLLSLR